MAVTAEELAHAFIAGSEAGALPDSIVDPAMTAWTTLQGTHSLERYRGSIAWMRVQTGGTLRFVIDAITASESRAVIEAHSTATLSNGESYANSYVFALGIGDGRITEVREHFNALVVQEKLIPLMRSS